MFMSFTPWLFQQFPNQFRNKWNICFIRITWGDWWKIINKIWLIIYNGNIRIDIHILSLHWMMKSISYFNVSEKPFRLHRKNINTILCSKYSLVWSFRMDYATLTIDVRCTMIHIHRLFFFISQPKHMLKILIEMVLLSTQNMFCLMDKKINTTYHSFEVFHIYRSIFVHIYRLYLHTSHLSTSRVGSMSWCWNQTHLTLGR